MTKNFDNFLLGLLWLLSIVLATTFWMNISYGFNILSAAHWAYLSELQASRTQIKFDFYISLIAAIVIGIVGLYIIMRPRIRRDDSAEQKTIPKFEPAPIPTPQQKIVAPTPTRTPEPAKAVEQPAPVLTPVLSAPKPTAQTRPLSPSGFSSHPQSASQTLTPPPPKAATPTPTIPTQKNDIKKTDPDIQNVFDSAGYIIKQCDKIGNLAAPVVALGYDNMLWIAAPNTTFATMLDAIQTLIGIFDDTLGDTANDITVHGCIVGTSEESKNPDLISIFANIDDFKQFMSDKPNTKPDDFDSDLFDAISTYISTVATYIGKQ